MAKLAIKNEKITAFGGINFVLDKFDALLGDVIDRILGVRSTSTGYQYSEIIRALFSVYFCGGDNTHLLIAKDIADTIKKHIEPEHVIDDKAKMCFLKEGDGFADGFVKEDEGEFKKSPKLLKEMLERMNKEMLDEYEESDLNWNKQADYAEHHKPSWLKRLLGRK